MYRDKAEKEARNTKSTFMDSFHDAEDYAQHAYDDVKERINKRPLKSALIALGVGFLLGKLF